MLAVEVAEFTCPFRNRKLRGRQVPRRLRKPSPEFEQCWITQRQRILASGTISARNQKALSGLTRGPNRYDDGGTRERDQQTVRHCQTANHGNDFDVKMVHETLARLPAMPGNLPFSQSEMVWAADQPNRPILLICAVLMKAEMFKIKICGVRFSKDIDAVACAGADAIGLNFFEKSIRYVDPGDETTQELSARAEAAGLIRVGVFVDAAAARIAAICRQVGLDAIQLHGDETTEIAGELIDAGLNVVRAIKLPSDLTADLIRDRCDPWIDVGCHLLLDAETGGSGKCLDWRAVGQWAQAQLATPWTLAGGLTEINVGEAIRHSGARSVDTASGVEQPRGTKSPKRIEDFVRASRLAFAASNSAR